MNDYTLLFSTAASGSILLTIVSMAAAPWLVASLPSDYLLPKAPAAKTKGLFITLMHTLKSLLGLIFVLLGLIMLVTPGPGIVMLLAGISLAEFPGKQRLVRKITMQPKVFKSLNWMRRRRGKPPFLYPQI